MVSTEPQAMTVPVVGDVIADRFRITGVVGRGAMGAVYAAEHVSTGQAVALKFMILDAADGSEFVARFEQEARVMAGLRHTNTIRIYDFGHSGAGAMFMAMELLHGQPLDQVIRENTRQGTTMSEREAADCGMQVLKSLEEAHRQGLVHRDLKPGNVFVTDDGSGETLCKVLDFGIARVSDSDMTSAGRLLGTPSYMSPEQWQGSRVDARADLYAVGCILYACVTGGPPFTTKENALALMNKHLNEAPVDPRERAQQPLSEAFCQVVATALAKAPGDRFADARAMRTALQMAVGGAWAGTPSGLSPGTPAGMWASTQRGANAAAQTDVHADATVALDGAPPTLVPGLVAPVPVAPRKSLVWVGVVVAVVLGVVAAVVASRGTDPAVAPAAVVVAAPAPIAPVVNEAARAAPSASTAAVPVPIAADAGPTAFADVPAANAVVPPAPAPADVPAASEVAAPATALAPMPAAKPAPRSATPRPNAKPKGSKDAPGLQFID